MKNLCFSFIGILLILSTVFAFETLSVKPYLQANMPVKFYINLGEYKEHSKKTQFIDAITAAFQKIQSVSTANIQFQYLGETDILPQYDDVSVIYFDKNKEFAPAHGATLNMKTDSNGYLTSADIAIVPSQSRIDRPETQLYALVLHEALHFIGLDHSKSGKDSAVFANTVNLTLSSDDIAGISALYPNEGNPLSLYTGTVTGKVSLEDGSGVYTRVVAIDNSKVQPRIVTAESESDGSYNLTGLPVGSYKLLFEQATKNQDLFVNRLINDLELNVEASTTEVVDVTLQNSLVPAIKTQLHEVVFHPSGKYLYSSTLYSLKIIDALTGKHVNSLGMADDIAVSADKMELYTVDQINRKFHVIDINESSPNFHQVIASINSLPFQPTNLVLVDQYALVASNGGKSLSIIDVDKRHIIKEVDTGMYNQNISIFDEDNLVYLSAFYAGFVKVFEIDGDPLSSKFGSIINTVYDGSNGAFDVKRYSEFLFVSTFSGIEVISFHTGKLVKVVCNDVTNFEMSSNNQYLYCISKDEANNTLIDTYLVGSFELINQQMIGNEKINFLHLNQDKGRLLISGAANNAYLFEVNDDGSLSVIPSLIVANGFSPKKVENNSTSKVTITGHNFPTTVTAQIEGEDSSCINIYYSSTSVEFNCVFSTEGNRRLELKAHPDDELFINNSGDWHIEVEPTPVSPVVSDFTPNNFKKNEATVLTVTGSDLLNSIEARIDGENEPCTQVSFTTSSVDFNCIASSTGQKRLYLKSHSDDELYINGSSDWYVNIQDTLPNEDTLPIENAVEETKGGGITLISILLLFVACWCRTFSLYQKVVVSPVLK